METEDQTLVQECIPENLDPAPIKDEYAPVIFSQETVSHIVSIDMMSGKVCFIQLMVFLIHFTTFHLIKQRTQTYYNSFSSEKKSKTPCNWCIRELLMDLTWLLVNFCEM